MLQTQLIPSFQPSDPGFHRRNEVLGTMIHLLDRERSAILDANQKDISSFDPSDRAMYDRLIVNDKKIDGMIRSVKKVQEHADPLHGVMYQYNHPNGLKIENRKAPFGTVLIIYESRPDVTIEAAAIAFKAANRILLKGGKEASHSNEILAKLWHEALKINNLSEEWIRLLSFDRNETQQFLRNPGVRVDLIVPRGGEGLIRFVKEHGTAPVLVSGRGNNFLFVHKDANWDMAIPVICNAKADKISACNALDKVLLDRRIDCLKERLFLLQSALEKVDVEVVLAPDLQSLTGISGKSFSEEGIWYEEFLAKKIVLGLADNLEDAITHINKYSGGHSASIITEDQDAARTFMETIDAAAVYHNASTRFTDGGEFGMGAELAISTDKLHHRGPLGLDQLVTNKYYIFGSGQQRL